MSGNAQIRLIASVAAVAVLCVVALVAFSGGSSHLSQGAPRPAAAGPPHAAAVTHDSPTENGPTTTAQSAAPPPRGKPVALGIYAGGGNASALHRADAFLGGAITGAFDYVPYTSWTALSKPDWLVDAWGGQGFNMTLAVPMFPAHGASLKTCATGTYDSYFSTLSDTLVAGNLASATLTIGWEPETGHYQWSVSTATEARDYVHCWRRIHAALTAVAGAHFTFMWDAGDPAPGRVPISKLYPGDRYVDVISTSAVDAPTGRVPAARQWPDQARWHYGADWAARFARRHRKKVAIFMLGLDHPRRDNAAYVAEALQWASLHHACSVTLWDHGKGALLGGDYPAIVAALKAAAAAGDVTRANSAQTHS